MAREGQARLDRARTAMAREGLNALLLLNSTNLVYLSGYPAVERTLARPHYLVVPQHGNPAFLVHEGRAAEARKYGWIQDVRTYHRLSVAPLTELSRLFADLGVRRGRIGCELGFDQRIGIPFGEFERIRGELSPARFEDASTLLWQLRMIKSSADLAALREACRITSEALERTIQAARPGTTDRAAAIAVQGHMTGAGASDPWVAIAAGRGNYDLATGVGHGQVLEPGDMVWMDAGCRLHGFRSDFGRAGVIGGPSADQEDAQRQIWEVTMEGVRMARPGVPVRDIAAHLNHRVEALGLPVSSNVSGLAGRVGHGLGLDTTEPPHISEEDPTVLEAGMVITIEPGIATEFGIFHVEQDVVVTPEGSEVISLAPWPLRSIPA
jgi:Xaa-Pro aminopeptidase